jgi:hypothetical protein
MPNTSNPEKNKTTQGSRRGLPPNSPWRILAPLSIEADQSAPTAFNGFVDGRAFNKIGFVIKKPAEVLSYTVNVSTIVEAATKEGVAIDDTDVVLDLLQPLVCTENRRIVVPGEDFVGIFITDIVLVEGESIGAGDGIRVLWRGLNSPTGDFTSSPSPEEAVASRGALRKVVALGSPITEWTLTIDTASNGETYGVDLLSPAVDDLNVVADGATSAAELADAFEAAWNLDATCGAAAEAVSDGVSEVTFTSLVEGVSLVLAEDENAAKMTLAHNGDRLADEDEVELDLGIPNGQWLIRRIRASHDAGTATTWNMRFGGRTGFLDGEAYVVLRASDVELSTADPINESVAEDDGWVVADAEGKVYLKWTFAAGADHVVTGSVSFEPIDAL